MLAEDAGEELPLVPQITFQDLCIQAFERHQDQTAIICRHQAPDFLQTRSDHAPAEENVYVASSAKSKQVCSTGSGGCLRWTYKELFKASNALAAQWYASGIRKGTRIAGFLYSGAEWVVAFYAAVLLGCAFAPINPALASKPDDVRYMLELVEASAVLAWDIKMARQIERVMGGSLVRSAPQSDSVRASANAQATESAATTEKTASSRPRPSTSCFLKMIAGRAGPDVPAGWVYLEDLIRAEPQPSQSHDSKYDSPSVDDLLLVIFTSGTTSRPKGVRHTYGSWYASSLCAAMTGTADRVCNCLPLFHAFGAVLVSKACATGTFCCIPSATFDAGAVLRSIEEERLQAVRGVPLMFKALVNHPARPTTDLSSLDYVATGASIAMPEVLKEIAEGLRCERVGCGYGMSEGVTITNVPYRELPRKYNGLTATCGTAMRGARVRVCPPGSRQVLERDQEGELHIGGPLLAAGYLGGVLGEFYQEHGVSWLATGDHAVMNEKGEVTILGRYKDMINRGGEKIAPATIEAVIDSLPGMTSQVVGIPDECAGEVAVAVLKTAKATACDHSAVHTLVTNRLGAMYRLAYILTIEDIGLADYPRTATGKIRKVELKPLVAAHIQALELRTTCSTLEDGTLQSIWSKVLSVSTSDLTPEMSIRDLNADSITIMQALSKINRAFQTSLSMADLLDAPTCAQQMALIERCRAKETRNDSCAYLQPALRDGPPTVTDVVCANQWTARLEEIRTAFEHAATPMALDWDRDVEDVVPIWDWGQVMLTRRRDQSFNHHHTFATDEVNTQDLRAALERAFDSQPMMRALAVHLADETPLHVVMRPSRKWYDCAITNVGEAQSPEDLSRLAQEDPKLNFAAAPGPLYRILVASIASTGGSAFVGIAQHSCFDGLSLVNFIEDVKAELSGPSTTNLAAPVPYKLWADKYFLYRNSALAQADVAFHVERLRGVGGLGDALWPFQRAPEWFKGGNAGSTVRREPLDGDQANGVEGEDAQVQLSSLDILQREHGLSASIVFRTALALLNVHYTHADRALFSSYEAGRDWPGMDENLPNALDLNGPTLELVLNKIAIDKTETCIDLLTRLKGEHTLLIKHAHAPLLAIQNQLPEEDGAGLIDNIMRRQAFNVLPFPGSDAQSTLRTVKLQARGDVGLVWNCQRVDMKTYAVNASYDDAQLYRVEVEEAVGRFCRIARWVGEEENLKRVVGECPDL